MGSRNHQSFEEECVQTVKSVKFFAVGNYFAPVLLILCILLSWEILVRSGLVSRILAPTPTEILVTTITNLRYMLENSWTTAVEVLFGYAAGCLIGVIFGVIIAYSKALEKILSPIIIISQTIPYIALAPVLVALFGYGLMPKLVLVGLITFFPITLAVKDGLTSVDPEVLRFIRSLGATEWQMFRKLKGPAAMPQIFTGIKVSATYAVLGAVVAELFGAKSGLGFIMMRAFTKMKIDLVFSTILMMSLMGMAIFTTVMLLERVIIPWHYARTRRQ